MHRGEPNATGQRLSAAHSFDLTDEDVAEATDAIEAARVQHYDRYFAGTDACPHCGSDAVLRHRGGVVIFRCGSDTARPDAQTEACETAQKAVWKVADEVAALRAEVERVNLLALDARKEAARDRERAERAEAERDRMQRIIDLCSGPCSYRDAAVSSTRTGEYQVDSPDAVNIHAASESTTSDLLNDTQVSSSSGGTDRDHRAGMEPNGVTTIPSGSTCGRCGKPAQGHATIHGVPHCHEGASPTCYEAACHDATFPNDTSMQEATDAG